MANFHVTLLLISSLMAYAIAQKDCVSNGTISPRGFHVDIFNSLLTSSVTSRLRIAPFIPGEDRSSPAYEFKGMGSGFSVLNSSLVNSIKAATCTYNEVTFTGRVYIRDSQSDGPLLELSYTGGLEDRLGVYLLHMDAAANEILLGYRHQGRLHSESIPVRLISGRWRNFAIVLSGNLLTFYFDCEMTVQRLVPLPDYCANDSSLLLSVADSVSGGVEYTGMSGLYVYLQKLEIHFGPGGITGQCPNKPELCPTCGEFLTLVQKLARLQDQVQALEEKVNDIERASESCVTTPTPPPVGPVVTQRPTDCFKIIGGQHRVFENGKFLVTSTNMICYCDNGNDVCATVDQMTLIPNTTCPDNTPSSTGLPGNPTLPTTTRPIGECVVRPLGSLIIQEGDLVSRRRTATSCDVYICEDRGFGLASQPSIEQCVRSRYSSCSINFSKKEKEIAKCCGICNACDFNACPDNTICDVTDQSSISFRCTCRSGFSQTENGTCQDTDECRLGVRPVVGHNCPFNSECINTIGSFLCRCLPGFSEEVNSLNNSICTDIDECLNTSICPEFNKCVNKKGSYDCVCLDGYQRNDQGLCAPVCETPCMNKGVCVGPNNCSCPVEFQGPTCEKDVDECSSPDLNSCRGVKSVCVNTYGGYFCRCEPGYQKGDGDANCTDVNECRLRIHNCIGSARCENTVGGFVCLCGPRNRRVNCTGSCVRKGRVFADGTSVVDNCRRCSCLGGEMSCVRVECDCNNPTNVTSRCCPECRRRDCTIKNGTITIRPGATWINPSNRCERYNCLQSLTAVYVNLTNECPTPNCSMDLQTTPMGKCCRVCMMPTCKRSYEGRTVSIQNGCKKCTCQNSTWVCRNRTECSNIVDCRPQDIIFNKNGCCPVCRQHILGLVTPQCIF